MKFSLIVLLLWAPFCFSQIFKEVSDEVGINYIYPGNDHQEVGAGITIIDVNNDGWDDIFQAGGLFPSKLWLNEKGKFIDASAKYKLNSLDSMYVQGAVAGDFNNDGYEDLFIANYGIPSHIGDDMPPVLLKNIKGKYFKSVYQNDFQQKGNYPGAAWGDIDNDGFIDLYVFNYVEYMEKKHDKAHTYFSYHPFCMENRFYQNINGKHFKEIAKDLDLNDKGCGLASTFTDFDNDNDVDLILLNDFGHWSNLGNKFYSNENGVLIDITDSIGFQGKYYGMGVGPGDIDNDGDLDYYLTNIGRNYMHINNGHTFHEVGKDLQLDIEYVVDDKKGTSWSGIFFDMENDGDVDLFVSKGHLENFEKVVIKDENQLFINDGSGHFTNISIISGINDSLMQRGAATLDFDHDGDLDIVCGVIKDNRSDFAKLDQKIKLFENMNSSNNNWIGIQLVGKGNVNKSCLGCSVTIQDEINGKQIREVDGGTGHSSQSSRLIYFGLGNETSAKNIEIQWLGHSISRIDELEAGHVYRIDMNEKVVKLKY